MVRGSQQNRAQAEKIAWNLKVDDLSRAVAQQLVGADPPLGEDIRGRMGLPLKYQVAPWFKAAAAAMQAIEHSQLDLGQSDEVAQLAGKGALSAEHRTPFDPVPRRERGLILSDCRESFPAILPWISPVGSQYATIAMLGFRDCIFLGVTRKKSTHDESSASLPSLRGTATLSRCHGCRRARHLRIALAGAERR